MQKDIYEIVYKAIKTENIDAEELKNLKEFLSDEENLGVYESLKKMHEDSIGARVIRHCDINKAYRKHLILTDKLDSGRKKLWINDFVKYVAVFVLVASISLITIYIIKNKSDYNLPKEVCADIVAGSHKAELILANGDVVNLEDVSDTISTVNGEDIHNTGKELVYKKDEGSFFVKTRIRYNTLLVPRGGEYDLILSDGTKVRLNSESKLRYPTSFSEEKRIVYLEGEAYFEVAKDKEHPFIVKTKGVNVRVLGTSFNVSSYEDNEDIQTTLVEGSIKVSDEKGEGLVIKPGYQASFSKRSKKIDARKVRVEVFTAWKDGKFSFRNTRMEDMMVALARWYDIDVFYMNEEIKDMTFTGGIKKYENIDKLLYLIENTKYVSFVKKGKTITIKKRYKR